MTSCKRPAVPLLLALSLLSCAGEESSGAARGPGHGDLAGYNVVLIVLDTLRADRLNTYGFPEESAPELDALAKRGVIFQRTVSQSSWTRPSLGSMLTSRYPRTLGIYKEAEQVLGDEFTTLAEVLAKSGYTNMAATANPNINTSFNFDQGFHVYLDSTVLFHWMPREADKDSVKVVPLQTARDIFTALLEQAAKADAPPYHVMATVMDIHEAFDERVDLSDYKHLFGGRVRAERLYLQSIRLVSNEVDRFVRKLTALPGWERTLFAIIGDHGQGLTSHPAVAHSVYHGFLLYESQVLVPMMLYSTGEELPAGYVVDRPVRLLDLMPTLLDLLGIEAPPDMAGVSLRPLLGTSEAPSPLPQHFIVETQFRKDDQIGIYTNVWKYIEYRNPHAGTDPRELTRIGETENGSRTNRIQEHPDVAERLAQALKKWEAIYSKAEPTLSGERLPERVREQLRSLGYAE